MLTYFCHFYLPARMGASCIQELRLFTYVSVAQWTVIGSCLALNKYLKNKWMNALHVLLLHNCFFFPYYWFIKGSLYGNKMSLHLSFVLLIYFPVWRLYFVDGIFIFCHKERFNYYILKHNISVLYRFSVYVLLRKALCTPELFLKTCLVLS